METHHSRIIGAEDNNEINRSVPYAPPNRQCTPPVNRNPNPFINISTTPFHGVALQSDSSTHKAVEQNNNGARRSQRILGASKKHHSKTKTGAHTPSDEKVTKTHSSKAKKVREDSKRFRISTHHEEVDTESTKDSLTLLDVSRARASRSVGKDPTATTDDDIDKSNRIHLDRLRKEVDFTSLTDNGIAVDLHPSDTTWESLFSRRREIGAGTYADVFSWCDPNTKKMMACKLLRLNRFNVNHHNRVSKMIKNEVMFTAKSQCPNVIKFHRLVVCCNAWVIVMDHITGGTLWAKTRTTQFAFIEFMQILQGLMGIHASGYSMDKYL
eukprot:GHVH01004533.1.p1 GENE.GHVH01004533.1~~GHVH01004533.1.p1  ORF type:complete len:326 (+),score=27.25 GHVH01004533.1:203-1180(+)